MFCAKCGVQNDDNLNFCANCGAPLNETTPVATGSPIEAQQQIFQNPVTPQQPMYQAPPMPMASVYPTPALPGKGLGIAGMVLGIVSLVFFCVFYIGLPCAIVGVVLSAVSASKAKSFGLKNGMATAGIVCSAIALGLGILVLLLIFIGALSTANPASSFY